MAKQVERTYAEICLICTSNGLIPHGRSPRLAAQISFTDDQRRTAGRSLENLSPRSYSPHCRLTYSVMSSPEFPRRGSRRNGQDLENASRRSVNGREGASGSGIFSPQPHNRISPSSDSGRRDSFGDFRFKSDHHHHHLTKRVQKLYTTNQLCDVCLICGNRRISCHRLVLAASSDYFSAMFTGGMHETRMGEIEIQGVEPAALEDLVNYCYTGEIRVTESNVEHLLSGAGLMQLAEVVDACSEYLKTQLHPSNCLGIRSFADAQGCQNLHRSAHEYITENFLNVTNEQEFFVLSHEELKKLLTSDDLNVPNEEAVYHALCCWIQHDLPTRRLLVGDLLPTIRLPCLSPSFIVEEVEKNELFRDDWTCRSLIMEAMTYHLLPNKRDQNRLLKASAKPRKATVGSVYAVGGMDANRGAMSIERYNFLRDKWMKVGEMSGRRLQFGVAEMDGRLLVVGGRDGLKTLYSFESWDPVTGQWEQMPPMNTPRHGLGVSIMEGPVYAVGGHDGWSYLSSVERWDPQTRTWTFTAEMSTPRSTLGVAVLNGRLYAVGGRDGGQVLKTVECYNPHTNKWTLVAPMNRRRSVVGVGVLEGYLYAVGGLDAPASHPSSSRFACVERYDPNVDQWTMVASVGSPRDGVGVCRLGHMLLAVGGFDGAQYLSTVECYSPRTDQWNRVKAIRLEVVLLLFQVKNGTLWKLKNATKLLLWPPERAKWQHTLNYAHKAAL